MSNRTQIVMHVMPHELSNFSRTIGILASSMKYLSESDTVSLYITLNLSSALIDWNNSKITSEEIIFEFNKMMSFYDLKYEVDIHTSNNIIGTTSQKRLVINRDNSNIEQFIFLDSDICFHVHTLKYILDASNQIDDEYYIVTPQTIKLWDETWDVITHKNFINDEYGKHKEFMCHTTLQQTIESVGLMPINTFKFGCGWFTLYSKSFLKFINIPEELGPYGSEDTYLMIGASIMKQQQYNINQYILDGIYISEDYRKPLSLYDVKYIVSKEMQYIKHDTPKFAEIANKLVNRLTGK